MLSYNVSAIEFSFGKEQRFFGVCYSQSPQVVNIAIFTHYVFKLVRLLIESASNSVGRV